MNKYNDGLNNETEVQIISTFRRPISQKTKTIISDLGTVPESLRDAQNSSIDVMYSDSDLDSNCLHNLNLNTLHHKDDNEAGCARNLPSEAFGQDMREKKEKKVGNVAKDLDPNEHYVQIEVQTGKLRTGRHKRMDVYISLMTENDSLYTITLTSDITNAFSEVRRSVQKKQYWTDRVEELISSNLRNLMIGRARYKNTRNRPLWQTKRNLGNILVAYTDENDMPAIILYLYDNDPILIPLDKELSEKQKQWYSMSGLYKADLPDL